VEESFPTPLQTFQTSPARPLPQPCSCLSSEPQSERGSWITTARTHTTHTHTYTSHTQTHTHKHIHIRASVWARKLDNKLEHTTTQVRCTLCVLTNETVRHIDTVRRTDTVRRIDTVRQQSTATWQQDVSTVWQPLSHGLHQQCTSKLYQKNETLRYKLEKHSQDSTRSFNNSCGLSTCLPPHTCYHITFGTSSWITWWVSQYFLTPWNPPQGRGPGRPHKLSPSLWPIVPIWEPCIKQYGSQAFALGNKSLY